MDRHHRVEQKGEIDALGLDGELERLAIAIERPGPLDGGNRQSGFIGTVEQALFDAACGLVDEPVTLDIAMTRAAEFLSRAATRAAQLISIGTKL